MTAGTRPPGISAILEEVARDVPGWTPHDQLLALNALALGTAHLGADILELGSWCGRSAVALGLAARASAAAVHCLDLFPERDDWKQNADGSFSMRVSLPEGTIGAYEAQTVWKEPFERDIAPLYKRHQGTLALFRETIKRYGLADTVTGHRGTSRLLETTFPSAQRYRLAFVD
ncbi:MAG: class I SAM-dependent methyltransferase, partial [Burkholderiales bacterium]